MNSREACRPLFLYKAKETKEFLTAILPGVQREIMDLKENGVTLQLGKLSIFF